MAAGVAQGGTGVSSSPDQATATGFHPGQAFLLAAAFAPFLGAALSDYAYTRSGQVQWLNFSCWLIAGGLVFAGFALLCTLAGVVRGERRGARVAGLVLVLAAWVLGLVNSFVHARDAWGAMPVGLVLSVIVLVLAGAAAWTGFAGMRAGRAP